MRCVEVGKNLRCAEMRTRDAGASFTASVTRHFGSYNEPLKIKDRRPHPHPKGGLRLISHLSERLRREKIYKLQGLTDNSGQCCCPRYSGGPACKRWRRP